MRYIMSFKVYIEELFDCPFCLLYISAIKSAKATTRTNCSHQVLLNQCKYERRKKVDTNAIKQQFKNTQFYIHYCVKGFTCHRRKIMQ